MEIVKQPDGLSLLGNIKSFEIASSDIVRFKLYKGDTLLLDEQYNPDASGRIYINIKDILQTHLSFQIPSSDIFAQTGIMVAFKATVESVDVLFSVIRAGVENYTGTAETFLQGNFLTWQPQELKTRSIQPQWLTYYNVLSASVYLKIKFYLTNGSSQVIDYATIATEACMSFNMQFEFIFSLTAVSALNKLGYYDVWIENASGSRLSYIQRYIYEKAGDDEHCYLFENSLGGIDSVIFTGDHSYAPGMEFENAEYDNVGETVNNKLIYSYTQNTGYKTNREVVWLEDFFSATIRYKIRDGNILPIILSEGSVKISSGETLHSIDFTYKYAADGGFLNIPRINALPTLLEIETPEQLFFLAPRLSEFPLAGLDDNILFPVQSPFEEIWRQISWGTVKEYIKNVVNVSVGPFAHIHDNKTVLDKLSVSPSNNLLFDGKIIKGGGAEDFEVLKYIKFENGKIRFLTSAYSDFELSNKGGGDGSGSGTGGTSYDRLDNWANYTTDRAGDVLSAYLGYDLHTRIKVFEDGNYAPAAHVHTIADVSGLSTELAGKAASNHAHADLYAPLSHVSNDAHLTVEQKNVLACLSVVEGRLRSSVSFVSAGEVSNLDGGSGSGSGSGGSSYNRLDNWADYTTDRAGDALSAALGFDLHTRINNKVDVVSGMGLSTNDYTTAEKTKLAGLSNYSHPSFTARSVAAAAGLVLSAITINAQGHVTDLVTKTLAEADIPMLPIGKISGLESALSGKAASDHNHSTLYAPLNHVGDISHLTASQRDILSSFSIIDGKVVVNKSFVSTGEISNKGGGSGSGSGGTAYERLDSFSDYTSSKSGYILSAGLGYNLHTRLQSVEAGQVELAWNNITGKPSVFTPAAHAHSEYASMVHIHNYLSNVANADANTFSGANKLEFFTIWTEYINTPPGISYTYGINLNSPDPDYSAQIATGAYGEALYYRKKIGTYGMGQWRTLLDSNNYNQYALPLTGGFLSGVLTLGANAEGLIINRSDSYYPQIGFNSQLSWGNFGYVGKNLPAFYNFDAATWYNALHAGNYFQYALPLMGGTLSGTLTINANKYPFVINNSTSGEEALMIVRSGSINRAGFGWVSGSGAYVYNYTCGKVLALKDDGTPHYSGNTLLHAGNYYQYTAPKYKYNSTSMPNSGFYKVKINSTANWMLSFVLRIYQGYVPYDIQISGYNYGENFWYAPKAINLGSSVAYIDITFGHDAAYNLWVAFPANYYTGIEILSVANGYYIAANTGNLFTITHESTLSGTVQAIKSAYRPLYLNDTNFDGTAYQAKSLTGFIKDNTITWGELSKSAYNHITCFRDLGGGGWAMAYKSGQMSMQVDGEYYANEGNSLVWHTGNLTGTQSGHTHSFSSNLVDVVTAGNEFNFINTNNANIWLNYKARGQVGTGNSAFAYYFGDGNSNWNTSVLYTGRVYAGADSGDGPLNIKGSAINYHSPSGVSFQLGSIGNNGALHFYADGAQLHFNGNLASVANNDLGSHDYHWGNIRSRTLLLRRGYDNNCGIAFYSEYNNAWQIYMAPAGINQGFNGSVTAPVGSFVTTWGLRSFIENQAGYGWTWESGTISTTTPTIIAELSSATGNFKTIGGIYAGNRSNVARHILEVNQSSFGALQIKSASFESSIGYFTSASGYSSPMWTVGVGIGGTYCFGGWYSGLGCKWFFDPNYGLTLSGLNNDGGIMVDSLSSFSWGEGRGALNKAIANDTAQTPLLVAYRVGTEPATAGAGRLFAVELLNTGNALKIWMGTNERYSIHTDRHVFSGNVIATGEISNKGGSDKRFKDNVQTIWRGSDVLRQLRPVGFNWNQLAESLNPEHTGFGASFIAQEMREILPWAVSEMSNKYLAIDKEAVIPYLVSGWQEHEDEITTLKRRVSELENQVQQLKNVA